MIKMMLEEDEYKRDDFVTLGIKIRNQDEHERAYSDYNKSDDKSTNTKSSANMQMKKAKKMLRARREQALTARESKIYGCMSVCVIIVFILFCAL
jgi:hypothetical protein